MPKKSGKWIELPKPAKLDLGCGGKKQPGFFGIDSIPFEGVDLVHDLRKPLPIRDNSVEEIFCNHMIEHFDAIERSAIVNEMYRILVPGGKATLIAPYGLCERAYGDPTHKWPPVVGFWFYYLKKEWRDREAPHCNALLKCDFDVTWGYQLHPEMAMKAQETQQFAIQWYVNAILEIHANLVKPDPNKLNLSNQPGAAAK